MKKSIFNTGFQQNDLTSKIVVGLERIAEAFRVLLWEHAKRLGLSPIQIQLLIFIKYHEEKCCTISYLAREFNMSKPTISDAVKALEKKKLVSKVAGLQDHRSFTIVLSKEGTELAASLENFPAPMKDILLGLPVREQKQLFKQISRLIYQLNRAGIIAVQRTCFACNYYGKKQSRHYCHLLQSVIAEPDIRLDCPEFEERK